MKEFVYPLNLPDSKKYIYIKCIDKGYLKTLNLINSLGGVIMLDQLIRIYKLYFDISDSGARKKIYRITKDMEEMNLIGSSKINTYKYFYLRRLASSFLSGDYNNYKKVTMTSILKHNKFTLNLLRAEYYITHKKILSNENLKSQLLEITKDIFYMKKKYPSLPYDLNLMNELLHNSNLDSITKNKLSLLPKDNLLRILWIDFYKIFNELKLQNQTISLTPFYYKLNYLCKENSLTLHYVPRIIIFDVHDVKYYSKKIDELFYKFFSIPTNDTRNMQKYYRINKTLGWEGYNHFAYIFKLIGTNNNLLIQKKKYIDSHVKDNVNAILLSNCETELIDVSKYFSHCSRNNTVVQDIDNTFDILLNKKLKNYN